MLQQTRELLCGAGAENLDRALAACLAQEPLMKPGEHKGGPATDMFDVGLPSDDIRAVLAVVSDAFDQGQATAGTRGRGLGGFVEAWAECLAWVEKHN
jgi:hypothetical protein